MANSTVVGRETDCIRDWESKVGVDLINKETRLKQAKKEQAELEVEVKRLIIENGELEQSIKAEHDAIKRYKDQEIILGEIINDLEADLKLLRMCVDQQKECLVVCGVAEKVQEEDKKQLKSKIQGQTASYEDNLKVAKEEQEKLRNEYNTKLEIKLKKEKVLNDEHQELEERIHKIEFETENQLQENKTNESNLQLLVQECTLMRMKIDKKKEMLATLAEETAQFKMKKESLDIRIKSLHNQHNTKKEEIFATKQKQCKLDLQMKELIEKENDLKAKKAKLQMEIQNKHHVTEDLENLKAQMGNVSLQVKASQQEADRLNNMKSDKQTAEIELSNLVEKSNLTSSNIAALNEELHRKDDIEQRKSSLEETIASKKEELQAALGKRVQLEMQVNQRQENLDARKEGCEESCNKLSQANAALLEKQTLLQNQLNPKMEEVIKLKNILEVLDKETVDKENAKNEMLTLVSQRTNEAHLENESKLDALKSTLDEKINQFKQTTLVVEKLKNDVSTQQKQYEEEYERACHEEKRKIEAAVEPVSLDYENSRKKELDVEWQKESKELEREKQKLAQKFISPKPSKKIQFLTKGINLETSSPFDVVLDSQDKTNRPPRLLDYRLQRLLAKFLNNTN